MSDNNPILNNPYEEPSSHYATNDLGELDYTRIAPGRRPFLPMVQTVPTRQGLQPQLQSVHEKVEEYGTEPVNRLRKEVGQWRKDGYPPSTITRVTRELLEFWFLNKDRDPERQLFYAQREAIETAIWLNEVAERSNAGQNLLSTFEEKRKEHMSNDSDTSVLPRIAFKMATGTGKTVVMAALIVYHYLNRQEYRSDTHFADYFLLVTPGITIKNRLGVLLPNKTNTPEFMDYYRVRWLTPQAYQDKMDGLGARIVITNYHAFEARTLQGNKRSPFDGKIGEYGKKVVAKEEQGQVVKRVLSGFRPDSRLLVINDEAHHCYLPRDKGQALEGEDTKEENARAAVWFSGLTEIAKRFKVGTVYDLSATPYYLTGSGFEPYSLFPWVVSDFGLTESIESGLVKIPFLPESDNTQQLSMPVLRNLYDHVRDELPKKGRKTAKADARKEGKVESETRPNLPAQVQAALEMLHKHYSEDYKRIGDLFKHPPVFIVVCSNCSVSKEVYKYLAGYEYPGADGHMDVVPGRFPLFSNYDEATLRPRLRPPTLLIDSDALENSNQVNEEFRKVFQTEIEQFKRDYSRIHGHGSVDDITDAEIMREVVNTVGKTGTLGADIKCVVSVSMLTEGWDANTVTHIMGLRAFGSQLLCEQVAGRALRRQSYVLQGYDKDGHATDDKRRITVYKFPPEYAQIIGVPFKTFKSGETVTPPPPDYKDVFAIKERESEFEITFPIIVGYRVRHKDAPITADFSKISPYPIDCANFAVETVMQSAFSEQTETLTVKERMTTLRDQELVYKITSKMLQRYYREDNGVPDFSRFNQLRRIVEEWFNYKVQVIGRPEFDGRRLLYYEPDDRMTSHINLGIMSAGSGIESIEPVFNYYNPQGSTKYVRGRTSRPVYPTKHSHVNFVVADTESWEQKAAKSLDDMKEVKAYAKNAYLNFEIPYVDKDNQDRKYIPDFIARCVTPEGEMINLIIEITGMNQDKEAKRWYTSNRWLPAVNAVREKYGYDEWRFVEVAEDIRNIKDIVLNAIRERD